LPLMNIRTKTIGKPSNASRTGSKLSRARGTARPQGVGVSAGPTTSPKGEVPASSRTRRKAPGRRGDRGAFPPGALQAGPLTSVAAGRGGHCRAPASAAYLHPDPSDLNCLSNCLSNTVSQRHATIRGEDRRSGGTDAQCKRPRRVRRLPAGADGVAGLQAAKLVFLDQHEPGMLPMRHKGRVVVAGHVEPVPLAQPRPKVEERPGVQLVPRCHLGRSAGPEHRGNDLEP
jgi:hypothetical protein